MQWVLEGEQAAKSSFPICVVNATDFDIQDFLSNPVFDEKEVEEAQKEDSGF